VSSFSRVKNQLHAKSVLLVSRLEADMHRIMLFWVMAASFACGLRIVVTWPRAAFWEHALALLPYGLVVGAPVASLMLAFRWFRNGERFDQPRRSFLRFGAWKAVGLAEAKGMPLYGATGLMASLMLGILINVPIRSLEFLTAIPAVTAEPVWLGRLSTLMLADVVLLSSLYCIAFVAALRHVPLFPQLMAMVWAIDIIMQATIYYALQHSAQLPDQVDVALHDLLAGNAKKVLISVAIWAPYLFLSRRVNLTYRHRVPAERG